VLLHTCEPAHWQALQHVEQARRREHTDALPEYLKRRAGAMRTYSKQVIPDEDMEQLASLNCGFRYGIGYCESHFDCPNAPWFKG